MVRGKGLVGILCGIMLYCGSLEASSDAVSASASAQITLLLGPRVQVRDARENSPQLLCMSHIPAKHYSVRLLTAAGEHDLIEQWQDRRSCVPLSEARGYKEILIVAD